MNDQEPEVKIGPTDQPPGTVVSLSLTEIETLRDRLEQQKANKLKAEQLHSTLSRIKAREKATRRSSKPGEKKLEDVLPNQPTKRSGTHSSSALNEKSNLLKKKLEEDRAKFESKKGQEDLGKVSEIVERLRVQLEDQDKTIQQMHSNIATTKLSQTIEEVKPESDIPPEVKQRIADLEMKILDLQENLKEKDSVISARTQAITLLSEDMARKGKSTVDTLEETRSQMKTMQANFIALEGKMNEERGRLREELDAKKLRVQQLEKNYRNAESARFDLSTRVAELQEKVVSLQSKNISLEENTNIVDNKVKELQEALENSNKQSIKIKAQFKAKLKALEEERDMLKKDEGMNEEINRLRERIADLEDEKGNLQLHLVDFDEIQEAGGILKERVAEMEQKLHRQESDLDSHIKAITLLESEKLDLIEGANKMNMLLQEKDSIIEVLQGQLTEIEDTKISLEMKCLELEEKLDGFIKKETDENVLSHELEKCKHQLEKYQEAIRELSIKLSLKLPSVDADLLEDTSELKFLQDVSSSCEEWQSQCSLLEEKLNKTLVYCNELEERKKCLESENKKLLIDCAELRHSVESLNNALNIKTDSSNNGSIPLNEVLVQKENEISNLNNYIKTQQTEIDSVRFSLQTTTAELHELSHQIGNLNCTKQEVDQLNETLNIKHKELENAASELEERTRKLSEYKKFHKLKSEDVLRISQELETVSATSQQKIIELEDALLKSQKTEEDLRKEITDLKEAVGSTPEPVDTKLQEQSLKIKKLAANVKLKTKLIKDLEMKIKDLEIKIEELQKLVKEKYLHMSSLENEKQHLQEQNVENNPLLIPVMPYTEEKFNALQSQINVLNEELNAKVQELELFKSSSGQKYETLYKIKELESQNKNSSEISEFNSDKMRMMEDEITHLNGQNKSLMSELEKMQETYQQDVLKNVSTLDVFEHEMLGSKKEIIDLSNQLTDVTMKYEQSWAKLQEKDSYIEDLEQQLEKVKLRLLQIESTVEERRRSLEEKAEMLGARLCEAEKSNIQLEKHEDELEQKLSQMLNTEEMLGNILQKLQEENSENSKSLSESIDKNIHLSQELDNERNKVQNLLTEINNLQLNTANYEKIVEDYENIKTKFKESQDLYSNQVLCLEKRLSETEFNMDGEIQRLLKKVGILEAERQDAFEKINALSIEKQTVEEDLCSLQQSIADVAKEELEQLRINHENLAGELNKELEKRQTYIKRIEELELYLSKPIITSETQNQEIDNLKIQLDKERTEKEELRYELLKEKAKIEVNDVVVQAEQTYFTMSGPVCDKFEFENLVNTNVNTVSGAEGQTSLNLQFQGFEESTSNHVEKINALEKRIASLALENADLKYRLQETQLHVLDSPENVGGISESDDWAAVSKDEDDGWGWGSKDALLEHEHIQKQKLNSDLESRVIELEKGLSIYQEENSRLLEELKASQLKCNKLMKKVREFKNKNDDLERNSREKSVGFDDLDFAMQEELKSQVEKLEKTLKECNVNFNALQIEREHLVKRIDTLTSGNERLVEMKERQDIEVEMWQRRSNDLQNKVQGLEWTLAELHAEKAESKSLVENTSVSEEEKQQFISSALELDEKLNALANENDYLQSVIVELKEKNKKNTPTAYEATEFREEVRLDSNQIEPNHLHMKEENDRLNMVINSLEKKSILLTKDLYDNEIECSKRIQNLVKENELLSSKIEEMESEMGPVNARMSSQAADLLGNKKNEDCMGSNTEESPTLFRGFTSESSDPFKFAESNFPNITFDVNPKKEVFMDSKPPSDKDELSSVDFFSRNAFEIGTQCIQEQIQPLVASTNLSVADSHQIPELDEYNAEVSKLKSLLCDQEFQSNSMRESVLRLEKENVALKEQIQTDFEQSNFEKPLVWHSLPGIPSIEFGPGNTSTDDTDLATVSNKLQEKDAIINYLKEKLNFKTGSFFSEEQNEPAGEIPETNDLNTVLLPSTDNQNSQFNQFVHQISQLREALKDKENEIRMLIDKKKKYKEMYYALAKEYDVQSLDQSTSNLNNDHLTDENLLLNQLLEDKETQLELMNQQIDQSTVAKENLQDELSLLCEIEAAKSTESSPKSKAMLLTTAQPENIEEVKTLCAEVKDLHKLLQEKDLELEMLKQQFDETNLGKDDLINELKKEIEKSKTISAGTTEELDLNMLKEVAEMEKLFKEELSLKDQQMMNLVNDLCSKDNLYKDIQIKLERLENDLKVCNFQNDNLIKELNDVKIVTNDIKSETEMSVTDKIKKLKNNVTELATKLNQAKSEIEEKDKTIQALVEKVKVLESHETEEKFDHEQQTCIPAKSFASEPFRISTEQSSSDDDSSSKHFETVQGQMMLMKEIQSLKQVLLLKDNEITRLSITLNEAQETLLREEFRRINSEEESLRLRLDEALYTLHLRDVRCDELSLELMQLLEERDSLQLRLSTAIRFNQELREKSKLLDEAAIKMEGEASFIPEADDNTNDLQLREKLDQLHNVGYRSRDPAMQQEQQRRHHEQMHLYTHQPAQEESQQSSGFFNWLFGTSTSGSQDV